MKKTVMIAALMVCGAFATDFSSMTTEELMARRGNVSAEERDAFKAEMQNRMQSMSPEERQQYMNNSGNGQKLRDGSGSGGQYKGSRAGGQNGQMLRDGSGGGMMGGRGMGRGRM